ncbi:hypothetical protein BH10BAC2_BH10BAC2_42960 [soil metagenome]
MKTIIKLLVCFILLGNAVTFGQKISKDFIDGEVYVKIKNEVPFLFDTLHKRVDIRTKLPFLIPLMNKYNITKADASFYFSHSNILKRTFRIHFSRSELVNKLIEEMKKMNQVEYVEKVSLVQRTNTNSDRGINQYSEQYTLNNNNSNSYTPNDLGLNQYALRNINAQGAWDVSRGNRSVIIAIVASAIDVNHEDLAANVVKQWDVSDDDANPSPPSSSDLFWEYGTYIAGIACATTNNGKGIASIGFNCGLMAVKVTPDLGNPEIMYDFYEGISWAVENGARVINCSGGGGVFNETEQNIINDAYDHNAIVIAGAEFGDHSSIQYPAGYNHVVAVAEVDSLDKKSGISNFGSWVDVSAPGVYVYSTLPANQYGQYQTASGAAASLVAGLCGLIWSVNPLLSYDQVVNAVINTTDNIDAQNPQYIGQLGSGRINAFRAVESVLLCNPSINLRSGQFTTPKTESSGTITSKNKIPVGAQVIFDAATKVHLLPGFTAKNGSVFHAYIDGCGNKFALTNNKRSSKTDKITADQKEENISADKLPVSSLNVFPNPARSTLNVSIYGLQTGRYNLLISNISGYTIKQKAITISGAKTTVQLTVADIPAGMYILRIAENPMIKPAKFVKE